MSIWWQQERRDCFRRRDQNFLASAPSIDLSRIEDVNTQFKGKCDEVVPVLVRRDRLSEPIAAEPDFRNLQSRLSERSAVQGDQPLRLRMLKT